MQNVLQTLGGLGIFLLAMLVMTEGLRGLAGRSLHEWLTVFTRSPLTGALTGTAVTGLMQSSSATIVATIGFVAADLLTFPQALGVVLGANLGTTFTGWLVAFFGFKLQLGALAMPLVLVGMLVHIFSRNWLAECGKSLAGFGLILMGIDMMQSGMVGFEGHLAPAAFPADSLGSRLVLVLAGAVLTMITQSSSASVAMAMTALKVGAINFPQAAAMVIGMNVGTTITPLIAVIGSSQAARRTAWSHTLFNLFGVIVGLVILSPYFRLLDLAFPGVIGTSPTLSLAGFHSLLNLVALLICLPLARLFARLMEYLVPEKDISLARRLDARLLTEPLAARAALRATLCEEFDYLLQCTERRLQGSNLLSERPSSRVNLDLQNTRDFLDALNLGSHVDEQDAAQVRERQQVITAIHALDHLRRMFQRLQQADRIYTLRNESSFADKVKKLLSLSERLRNALPEQIDEALYRDCAEFAHQLFTSEESSREETIELAVKHRISVRDSGHWLAANRWLEHMAHHLWRVSAHLGGFDILEDHAVMSEQPVLE